MRGVRRWLFAFLLLVLGALSLGERAGRAGGEGEPSIEIVLVSHGYHTGLIVPRQALADAARHGLSSIGVLAERFARHAYLEIGWGDARFYQNVPDLTISAVPEIARALFGWNNQSVLHVVGFSVEPEQGFPHSKIIRLKVSDQAFRSIAQGIEATMAGEQYPIELAPGLYGHSRFIEARGRFHLLNVCNHWIAELLVAAGFRVNRTLAVLPQGLFFDLTTRSGAVSR